MNLIIDVGNTQNKFAVFENGVLLHRETSVTQDFQVTIGSLVLAYKDLKNCILSSSGRLADKDYRFLKNNFSIHVLTHDSKIPFKNLYKTPTTLGVDRIALIAAAAIKYPKKNVLVIDTGSAITFDFLSMNNEYLGGAISPGILMRYKALNAYTVSLPLLKKKLPKTIVGNTTKKAIHSGVVQGVLFEIEGAIQAYKSKYGALTIILTGGDAHFLRDSIKNDIFADSIFQLEGLNNILENNKD